MAKSRFSFTSEFDERTPIKENLQVLRKDGLNASAKNNGDGKVEYRISGDEETVSKWRRLIGG